MEEALQAQAARKRQVEELLQELEQLSAHYEKKLDLQDRIRTWCNELMDDLLLIDAENLESSRYRRLVHAVRSSVEECWHKIQVCYGNITRDVQWLRNRIEAIEPNLVELWWLMAENIKKRFIYITDLFLQFFEAYVKFKELIQNFSVEFENHPHFIFEIYKDF